MDAIFNSLQRPALPLPQVVQELERLRDDPRQLAYERLRFDDDPPPPYSELGETTGTPTPNPPPAVDKTSRRDMRLKAHYKSTPINQFKSQAKRERERLEHQLSGARYGRRQTLPWDNSLDPKANAENNVRSRWAEQGIWGHDWGPAWPKNSEPLTTKWLHEGGGPFHYPRNPATSHSRPGARWGHEQPDQDPDQGPDPDSAPEREQALDQEQDRRSVASIFDPARHQQEQPKPARRRPIGYIQTPLGPVAQYPIPVPTVPNPEASRPCHQFACQIPKEREWIRDETAHTAPGRVIDVDAEAYESVKNNWIKDGVWHPEWDDQPGRTWKHEESEPGSDDDEDGEPGPAPSPPPNPSSRRPSGSAHERQPALPQYPNLFARAPLHGDAEAGPSSSERSNISPDPRRSKRKRESDTAADEQRPKRSRDDTLLSRNKSPALERAVPMTNKRGETAGATSIPPRRSLRIAEKQASQAANPLAETQRGQPKSVQTKTARKGRSKHESRVQDDQNGKTVMPKNASKPKRVRTTRAKARK